MNVCPGTVRAIAAARAAMDAGLPPVFLPEFKKELLTSFREQEKEQTSQRHYRRCRD